jgi:hypothetical protein
MSKSPSDLRARLSAYHVHTKGAFTGFLMGVPLTLAYALALVFGPLTAEKRDFLIRLQIDLVGETPYKAIQLGLAGAFIVLTLILHRKGRFEPSYFGPLVVESMLYAALASVLVWFALEGLHLKPAFVQPQPGLEPIVSALGEAVNEETLFRWIQLELLYLFAHRVGTLRPWIARSLAVLVGAGVFAAVGTFAAPLVSNDMVGVAGRLFTLAVAGLFFGALYFLRGYPACAYTHVFYATFWGGIRRYL